MQRVLENLNRPWQVIYMIDSETSFQILKYLFFFFGKSEDGHSKENYEGSSSR